MNKHSLNEMILAIRNSGQFDEERYRNEYRDVSILGMDPIENYIRIGEKIGRQPSDDFDPKYYYEANPDVKDAGMCAFFHFVVQGRAEGRPYKRPGIHEQALLERSDADEPITYIPRLEAAPLEYKPVRLIAFYLPQFHAIPENDEWWGKGFTEWTNVKPAMPQFEGHYQPHEPDDYLGYYNLLNDDVRHRQVELAKLYGLGGFCFYFYWFGGKRLLEEPTRRYLEDKSIDFPFCLCWANENWSRRWDGKDSEILIGQNHSPEDDLAFIEYVSVYLRDPRCIRIDGRPLLLVYRPSLLPDARATVQRWREWCRENGIGEIYLAYTQSFEAEDPQLKGFDAAIEFPPNNTGPTNVTETVKPFSNDFAGTVFDWSSVARRSENYAIPAYKLFRGVCPSWDNTARRKSKGTMFINSSPRRYQRWLENAIDDTCKRFADVDERLVFINAWNEWAEGTHLEPEKRSGYANLDATRKALERFDTCSVGQVLVVTHDCHPHGAQFLALSMAKTLKECGFRVHVLALDGGRLLGDFRQVADTFVASEGGPEKLARFLQGLRHLGVDDVIANTVVSGSIVQELKKSGFRVLSLIHELPGVITAMKQEANAQSIAQYADKIVFPAALVRDGFLGFSQVNAEKVMVLSQGLIRQNPYRECKQKAYQEVCRKHQLPDGCQIVLSIGYTDARKGPDLFVEMAKQVLRVKPNTAFIWVGHFEPQMHERVKQNIEASGHKDRILFIGFDKEPLAYYAAASVYALTSREDPFPNVVLEASEVGVSVVAFEGATGAADYILQRGGALAKQFDIREYADKVIELLDAGNDKTYEPVPSMRQYMLDLLHELNGFKRVSVIVPNYNYANVIAERLRSICEQAYPYYELIVLDDASKDDSVAVIKNYLANTKYEATLVVNDQNSGSVFRQWKRGVELVKGDLIWIAEADDLSEREFLKELTGRFDDPDVVMAYSQSKQIDEKGNLLANDYLYYTKDIGDFWERDYKHDGKFEIANALCIKNTIPNVSAVIFKHEILKCVIDDLRESLWQYRVSGDWIVYIHAMRYGLIGFISMPLNTHRRHTSSVTSSLSNTKHYDEICQAQNMAKKYADVMSEKWQHALRYRGDVKESLGIE